MEIITGKKPTPVKGIIYGVAGIGKTTFAAKWPKPLFLDVEQGSYQLDVARVVPKSYAEFKECIRQLQADAMGYQTLVIDSADWLEQMMVKHICIEAGINSIEKYEKGYGKGWNKLAEDWAQLLDQLDRLRIAKNMHILFIVHSKIKRYEPADDTGYDRYTLTLADRSADVLKKWSDLMLFVKYETFTVEDNGKIKVKGSGKRIMFSQFCPWCDAKSRYALPAKMPFEFSEIAKIFTMEPAPEPEKTPEKAPEAPAGATLPPAGNDTTPPPELPPAPPETPPPPEGADEPPVDDKRAALLQQIEDLIRQSGVGYGEVAAELERKGVVPAGTAIRDYNLPTLQRVIAGWTAIVHNINLHKKGN